MRPTEIDSLATLRTLRVADVMAHAPSTVAHDAHVSDAVDIMERVGVRHLPVTRNGVLAGLITERGVRDAMPSILALSDPAARRKSLEVVRVEQIWIPDPTTIEPDATLGQAIRTMRRLRASSLPVMKHGKLVGILTSGDLITVLERVLGVHY